MSTVPLDAPETIAPWARGGGEAVAHLSEDGGESWTETNRIATAPFSGGYGMRSAWCCPWRRFCCPSAISRTTARSSWCAPRMAGEAGAAGAGGAQPGSEFEEPALLRLPSGRLLLMMRDNGTRRMHQVFSETRAKLERAEALPIEGYPPHLLAAAGRAHPLHLWLAPARFRDPRRALRRWR
jgi:hypothetical protein